MRDRTISVYGRKPVLEALAADGLEIAKIHIATGSRGGAVGEIRAAASAAGIVVEEVSEARVTAIARNGRQHQGVVADVVAPRARPLGAFCDQRRSGRDFATTVLVLDHVHNPANVGMAIRSATAAGIDGIVVPEAGTAAIGPLVIKASAGVAFHAPILFAASTAEALDVLADERFALVGLAADAPESLFDAELSLRCAVVVGNETDGLSPEALGRLDRLVSLPLAPPVESLNVACAVTLVAYDLRRRASGTVSR